MEQPVPGQGPESNGPSQNDGNEVSRQALAEALAGLREEMVGGLMYAHNRANANTSRVLESSAFLFALIELLDEKGIVKIAELDARRGPVADRLAKRFLEKGMGVSRLEPLTEKIDFGKLPDIDCASKLDICGAACCRFWFPLSQEEVDKHVILWDLEVPYTIAQDAEHYCRHLDRGTCRCTVYEDRPTACRAFDCRKDKRIWLDFEAGIMNPNIEELFTERQARFD